MKFVLKSLIVMGVFFALSFIFIHEQAIWKHFGFALVFTTIFLLTRTFIILVLLGIFIILVELFFSIVQFFHKPVSYQ